MGVHPRSEGPRSSARRWVSGVRDFYWGSGISDDVPALAWFLISACVPLLLGIAAIAAIVLGDSAKATEVATKIAGALPRAARGEVLQLVLRTHRDSPLLLAISVGSMVWVASGATGVIERVESRLLGAPRPGMVKLEFRHLIMAAGMVSMISLAAIAATQATALQRHLSFALPSWLVAVASALLIGLVCAFLYRYATTRRIAWRAALAGGLPAGIIVELTPLLAGYYTRAVAGRTPVQVFLVLAGLLFTCYIVAQGLLIGAGLAVRAEQSLSSGSGARGRSPDSGDGDGGRTP